jgi:hypothetical protein
MILDKNVNIIINKNNIKHFTNLGFSVKNNDIINIPIINLSKGSKTKLLCSCDNCGAEKNIEYWYYVNKTKDLTDKYFCIKCSGLKRKVIFNEKYGVDNPSQLKSIKDKKIKTSLEKYGVDNPFKSNQIKEKSKKTCLEKYGTEYPSQSEFIKEKSKKTCLEKYGTEYYLQSKDVKEKSKKTTLDKYGTEYYLQSKDVKEKSKKTCLDKYGVDHVSKSNYFKELKKNIYFEKYGVGNPIQNLEIKEKIKQTNLKKYGVVNPSQYPLFKENIKNIKLKMYNEYYIEKFKLKDEYTFLNYEINNIILKHKKCNNVFSVSTSTLNNRTYSNLCLCTYCYPISESKSIKEKELINWLKELDIYFIESDKTILNPKHLDIYMPSTNLAIEFNGLYWHSEKNVDKKYHLDKSLKCLEKGIQLLHIWEDEWVYKKDIIKSIILNRLGLIKEKIYARHCEIRVVEDSKLVREFLDENHIQGYSQSSIKLGLYYQNVLVSLMTFGYRHTNAKKEFELIRFCNRINLNVIGAASKLFNYFKQNYQFTDLISYSDFRLFDGKMYGTLGFTKQHLSKPDYFWCKDLERKHRFNFNKQRLIKEGYDVDKTEVDIMHERGYYRVFGCGQIKWLFKKI